MSVDPRAGQLPEDRDLVDLDALLSAYHEHPPAEPVAFGTSGHRGTSLDGSFTEAHVVAISAAVCRYRSEQGTSGPLYLGRDTHALSEPAFRTIVEVLVGHHVDVVVDADGGFTPTPVISHAILTHRTAVRPTPTSPAGSSARPTGCSSRASTACRACRSTRPRPPGATTSPPTWTSSPP
jgi:phosphoglucomutase